MKRSYISLVLVFLVIGTFIILFQEPSSNEDTIEREKLEALEREITNLQEELQRIQKIHRIDHISNEEIAKAITTVDKFLQSENAEEAATYFYESDNLRDSRYTIHFENLVQWAPLSTMYLVNFETSGDKIILTYVDEVRVDYIVYWNIKLEDKDGWKITTID
ncbi:hypothetical protein ACERII_07460 [Evansella sp. AB-rgal1]|uniref:hypothetical protein n=1 Tax=Evansella sp. AB-rgal1 TaxID=3242696 RepID=UPI00359E8DB5